MEKSRTFILLLILFPAILWFIGLAPILKDLFSPGIGPSLSEKDFANYWLGGKFAVSGLTQSLYQIETYFPKMQEIFGNGIEIKNWSYPPHTLLFLWPLGLLSYKTAAILFFVSGLGLYLAAADKFHREYGAQGYALYFWAIHLPFLLMMLYFMQNGFHLAALALFGFLFMKKLPMVAGLCFAIMTIKPQLGILIPFLLIFASAWRCIFWSIFLTILLVGISISIYGADDWYAYFMHTIPYQTEVMHNWRGIFINMMPSLFSALRLLNLESPIAFTIHMAFAAIFLPVILWFIYKEDSDLNRIFITVLGTFILAPYSFNYDMGAFVTLCGIYLTRSMYEGSFYSFNWALLAVFITAFMYIGLLGFPISPVVLCGTFIIFAIHKRTFIRSSPIGDAIESKVTN